MTGCVKTLGAFTHIVTLDNHYLEFGQGVMVGAALARTGVRAELSPIGLTEIPACGSNADVLAYHGLDGASIARTVMRPGTSPLRALVSSRTCLRTSMYPELRFALDRRRRGAVDRTARTFEKRRPSDDRVIAQVARGGAADVAHALASAAAAAPDVGHAAGAEARRHSRHAPRSCCASARQQFGEIVQLETGKPWKNAVAEVGFVRRPRRSSWKARAAACTARRCRARFRNRTVQTLRSPIGICAAIMPFNSPLAGIAWKVFPALLCGNAVVVEVARADAVHRGRVRQAVEGRRPAGGRLLGACRALAPMSARRSCRTIASASSASPDRRRPAS